MHKFSNLQHNVTLVPFAGPLLGQSQRLGQWAEGSSRYI